jgi:hypothetical protein
MSLILEAAVVMLFTAVAASLVTRLALAESR